MRKRTRAREYALTILYQAELTRRNILETSTSFWAEKETIDDAVKTYTDRIIEGVHTRIEQIDELISKYATNWQLKRMAVIDRNVMRLSVFELLFLDDIPPKVAINEGVELAKKYGDMESSKFVNGVLDKIHKSEKTRA